MPTAAPVSPTASCAADSVGSRLCPMARTLRATLHAGDGQCEPFVAARLAPALHRFDDAVMHAADLECLPVVVDAPAEEQPVGVVLVPVLLAQVQRRQEPALHR